MLLSTPAAAAQTLVVSAGAESPGGDVQLNAFAPNMINVNVGDTVTWHLDSTEFHNIYFPPGTTPPDFVLAGPDGVFINPAGRRSRLAAQATTAALPPAAGCSTRATRTA